MNDHPAEIVRAGYDEIADRFVAWRDEIAGDPREWWSQQLQSRLPDGARVLELGCGAGVPDTRRLVQRFRVTGVDISTEQIRRARANVPEADFVVADFTALDIDPVSYDAVVAFYSFNHVPRSLLPKLFADIRACLTPGGLFLTALGTGDTEGWTGEWLGTTMFFSSFPPDTNSRLLDEAGFERLLDEVVAFREPDGDASFQWVLAQA